MDSACGFLTSLSSLESRLAPRPAKGVRLRLVDGKVRASFPACAQAHVTPVLEHLRRHRDEILRFLKTRDDAPAMPAGVRLVKWKPKSAPVELNRCSVVIDVGPFISSTLQQLAAALAGKNWQAGNWSIPELVDRLAQVGIEVELERPKTGLLR